MAEYPIDKILATLNQASIQQKQPAIYEAIHGLIKASKANQNQTIVVQAAAASQGNINTNATFLTATSQTAVFPSSRELTAANGITFSDIVSGVRSVAANLQELSFTLTNAQFKALPTTSVLFGTAPGVGFWFNVVDCAYVINTTAGAYTNIDPDFARLFIDNTSIISGPVNDSTSTPPLTAFTDVFGAAHNCVYKPVNPYVASYPVAGTAGWVINPDFYTKSSLENKQFRINAENNLAGDFTGGNAANTVTVLLKYYVEPI